MKLMLSLLILIFSLTGYALFTQILFAETNLIELKGELQNSYQFIKKEEFGGKEIKVAYLSFTFKKKEDQQQFFNLKVNIDSVKEGANIFGGVRKSLKEAKELHVWIEKSEKAKLQPRVYKILADEENIYERINKPLDRIYLFAALAISVSLVGFFYYFFRKQHLSFTIS